jgi:predicted N-acetyltransferase YhbS
VTERQARRRRAGERVVVRQATAGDLPAADAVLRSAFDTFTSVDGLFGDADYLHSRWRADPRRVLVAELAGEVVGSNIATSWGSVAWFGPLSVVPRLWNEGVAHPLLDATHELLARSGATELGLFTFPQSPKHLSLYARHGYWPGALVLVTERRVARRPSVALTLHGRLADREQRQVQSDVTALASAVHSGLDLAGEVRSTSQLDLGDTVLLHDAGLSALAVCHLGAGTEAGSGRCRIKSALVRPGSQAPQRLTELLDGVDALAVDRGVDTVITGVSAWAPRRPRRRRNAPRRRRSSSPRRLGARRLALTRSKPGSNPAERTEKPQVRRACGPGGPRPWG